MTDSSIWLPQGAPGEQGPPGPEGPPGPPGPAGPGLADYIALLASNVGSNNVGFLQAGSNAQLRTVQSKERDILSVKDFGAIGDGTTDDTVACQRAINAVVALGKGTVFFPAGSYYLTATLTVPGDATRTVVLQGAGHGSTMLYRKADYGDTIRFNDLAPTLPLVDCGVQDFTFYHDTTVGGGVVSMTKGAAVNWIGVVRGTVKNCYSVNHYDGFNILGGSSILFDHLYVVGYNGVSGINGVSNSGFRVTSLPLASPAGTVPLPSKVVMFHCGMGGVPNKAANYCYLINGGEQIELVSCEGSGGKINNIRIEQLPDNSPILEIGIRGGYYDTCDSVSIWVGGPTANGSAYIANVQIHDAIIKASGFGNALDGIYVDGTVRAAPYAQAVRGIQICNNSVSTFLRHGININGGLQVMVSNNLIRGNNYSNTQSGSGLVLGPNVGSALVTDNIIGGSGDGNPTGNQLYGILVAIGALNYTIKDNDLRGNLTGTLNDGGALAGTSNKRITGNIGFNENRAASSPTVPATNVDLFNPFGSPATVSIFGGTVTDVKLNGQTIVSALPVMLQIGAGDRIRMTYSAVPTWIWFPR